MLIFLLTISTKTRSQYVSLNLIYQKKRQLKTENACIAEGSIVLRIHLPL